MSLSLEVSNNSFNKHTHKPLENPIIVMLYMRRGYNTTKKSIKKD